MHYLYELTSKKAGKKYIGQTVNPERRKEEHLKASHNSSIKKDVEKFGKEAFEFEIVGKSEDPIAINWMEINAIEHAATYDLGCEVYNKAAGGQLFNDHDRVICNDCGDVLILKDLSMGPGDGMVFFRVSPYPDNIVEETLFLCESCKTDGEDRFHDACFDRTRYPYTHPLVANVLLDLVISYNLPEIMVNKLMVVDGKVNPRMAYAYFTKRLGWK